MRTVTLAVLVLAGGSAVGAAPGAKERAHDAGKTIVHGAKSVGNGASKVYHDVAGGLHRGIAEHSHTSQTRAAHLKAAASHKQHARASTRRSRGEMRQAGDAAGRTTR